MTDRWTDRQGETDSHTEMDRESRDRKMETSRQRQTDGEKQAAIQSEGCRQADR